MMVLQALRGTTDVLADEVKRWSVIEHTARRLARLYGYEEIRTPLIEDAALFLRSIGETTDIVQKEMFHLADRGGPRAAESDRRGGHDIVLRPEGTASIVRAYLEHNLHKTQGFSKLFYLGPMFRAERPQAGRFRQFHQFGVEALGSSSAWVDVEVITLCLQILQACGIPKDAVWLSSMGCRKDQQRSAEQLRQRLAPFMSQLCKECQSRFDKNVFRVLDCKNPTCHEMVWSKIKGSPFLLCEDCTVHFDQVRRGLTVADVSFDDRAVFARGLDYYTRTVFEVRAKGLGAQDAVAAGGRYDHLVEELGGPSVGAVGFAAGLERLLMVAQPAAPAVEEVARRGLYLAIAQPNLTEEAFRFVQQLRERGVSAAMDFDGKSLKAQLREANKQGCQFVAILGDTELKQRMMTVKDLGQGGQRTVSFDAFVDEMGQHATPACHAPR